LPNWILIILLMVFSGLATAADLLVTDLEDNDISVKVYPSDSEILLIWVVDHRERRDTFEQMLNNINQAGIEIWRVDLLSDYFLTRSDENQRTLSGDGVLALIKEAHNYPHRQILIAGYDRMPLAILRGIRQWQETSPKQSKLAGAVFFYPNLFGPTPLAGEDPVIDSVVEATTVPVFIYQPDQGYQRWRIKQVMESFWNAGSQAFVYLVPEVRDWFFMGVEDNRGQGAKEATARIPRQLKHLSGLMASLPRKTAAEHEFKQKDYQPASKDLVSFSEKPLAPGFSLTSDTGEWFSSQQYQGKVLLVNFWATWCPPCVEEIPSLNALLSEYLDTDFDIVSINYRETAKQLHQFTSKIPVNFPVLMDYDGKVSLLWKVFSFPSSFIVDKQGRVRYSINLAIDWNSEEVHQVINKLLNE
jgi:peroxiredoxin